MRGAIESVTRRERAELPSLADAVARVALPAVLCLAVASVGLAALLPVYTDEIVWKVMQGRLFTDGFQVRTLTMIPTCGPDSVRPIAVLVPFRALDALVFGALDGPLSVRVLGVGYFLGWVGITWLLLRRVLAGTVGGWVAGGAVVGLATLGVMPFLMVLSRPEQTLLIGMTVLLLLCVDEHSSPAVSPMRQLAAAAALVVGCGVVLEAHPRAIFALPLMVCAAIKLLPRRMIASGAAAAIAALGLVAYQDWSTRFACPGDAFARKLFDLNSITLAAADGALGGFLARLRSMLLHDPGHFFYLFQFGFHGPHTSDVIPPYPWDGIGLVLTLAIAGFVAAVASGGLLASLGLIWQSLRARRLSLGVAALASVWAVLAASLVARTYRNDYEAALIVPMLALVAALSIWTARRQIARRLGPDRVRRLARAAFAVLLVLSGASQVALLAGYAGAAAGPWTTPGRPPGQPFSVSVAGYDRLRAEILQTAAQCSLAPDHALSHLVVDEMTYFPFRQSREPYFMLYLHPKVWGGGIGDLRALLASRRAAGMIVGCDWVPDALRGETIANGRFCCAPAFAP